MLLLLELCTSTLYHNSCRGRSIHCWLAAYMTILAHEINRILSTVAAVQMCMMIFMIICFSISDLNPNLLFLHLLTSVERF